MPDHEIALPKILKPVYDKKPAWVDREITKSEAAVLSLEIGKASAKTAIEIGVASGFSSAVILSSLGANTSTPQLSAFDLSEECYFDRTKKTGQAVGEIFGGTKGYTLKTGVTSADIPGETELVDFIFIDAGHRHPWPALDLLSLHRFIKPCGTIALHDVNWPLQAKGAYRQNGPRDLIRAWVGVKRIYKGAVNIGFVDCGLDSDVFESICRALSSDWDEEINELTLAKYLPMAERFGVTARARLAGIFEEKKKSAAKTQLVRI